MGPYRVGDVAAERYEIRERVATGPLYWTYGAFDQEDERSVALRVIRQTIIPRSRDHETFIEQIAPLLSLADPDIAQLLRSERDEGKTLVISELVDGLPLRALLDLRRQEGRAFNAVESLAVLQTTAEALASAAEASIHGDLRPPHITIVDQGITVEALGLAAALPREETIRALRDDPDACSYLAPEILKGDRGDPRADVYSLAMIAGELLTGRIPPVQDSSIEDFLRHLPPLADELLRRSLSADLDERDDTPLDLVEALTAVLGTETWRRPRRNTAEDTQDERVIPKDPSVPVEPDADGTIPMASPLEAAAVPKDPAVPTAPAEDGTIPIASPAILAGIAGIANGPGGLSSASADAEATQKNSAKDIAKAVEALDDNAAPTSIERDPRVPVEAAPSGTQQITADMLEPVDDPELQTTPRARDGGAAGIERDPRVPVEAAPSGTQQITADMLEPVDDDPELDQPAGPKSGSLGLDPRLVRAARRLDQQRGEPAEPLPQPPQVEEENVETVVQHNRLSMTEPEPRTERQRKPPAMSPPPETPPPKDQQGPLPSALLQSSLGPIQVKVASTKRDAVATASPHAQAPLPVQDPPDLPAVVVDESLTDAFGPAVAPPEPTYKVNRSDALRRTNGDAPVPPGPNRDAEDESSASSWWLWLLIALGVGLTAILFGIILVSLLN